MDIVYATSAVGESLERKHTMYTTQCMLRSMCDTHQECSKEATLAVIV